MNGNQGGQVDYALDLCPGGRVRLPPGLTANNCQQIYNLATT